MTLDLSPGFVGPYFDEKLLGLGHPKLRPTFGRPLLILQTYGTLTGCP